MPVLEEIQADLAQLSPGDYARMETLLLPVEEGETVLAKIPPEHGYDYYVLAYEYARRQALASHSRRFDVTDPEQRKQLEATVSRYSMLGEIVVSIAWLAMKDYAGPSAWAAEAVGMRAGAVLVSTKADVTPQQAVRMSPTALAIIDRWFKRLASNEDDDESTPPDKSKVQ